MKCSKHEECEAWWDGNGRLRHSTDEGVPEGRPAAAGRRKARKRAAGGRRGGSQTTEAVTRTTTPATQTADVVPEAQD